MKSQDIRNKFIQYFEKKNHTHVNSGRLVPEGDPTLLFTNAGMNQFKNIFLGLEKRPYNRAVTAQKCVRAGGKHNDLENVGYTARHHTFFEMLGNFSFGDYFKKDAIHFAWELITKDFAIPKDRLYATVFNDDDEAAEIWEKSIGLSKDRIYRFGEKDNFWRMGDTGPCGPCSEIFFDLGPEVGGDPKQNVMGGEGDRFMEIWNLVFMQFEEDGSGSMKPLARPSIDTGMGLERLTAVLQGQISNYHTDLFQDLFAVAEKISGHHYLMAKDLAELSPAERAEQDSFNVAFRVLADHARAAAFLIGDGVLPTNEGRGYVLRRIMRRGIRFGRTLTDHSIYPEVVSAVIKKMGSFYSELPQQQELIERTVQEEEQRFLSTLDQGTLLLQQEIANLQKRGQKVVPGDVIFKLYDTYGFPADLTRLMSSEKGLHVDEAGFEKKIAQAKEKARASWKGKGLSSDAAHMIQLAQEVRSKSGATVFTGYETTQGSARLLAVSDGKKGVSSLKAGQSGILVFDWTPFYAEGGGQVGDHGSVQGPSGFAEVLDCTKQNDVFFHHVQVTDGELKAGSECQLSVLTQERRSTANNHSATHLLHAALRETLGTHVAQAGSLVDAERLRFDFTHNKPLTVEEIQKIEGLVNQAIGHALNVSSEVLPQKKALEKGALALFGEKYGDEVRVIQMGDVSIELCGGTHVSNTSQIRAFKIVSESGVSSGVRRIEAVTGDKALTYLNHLAEEALQARAQGGRTINWTQVLEQSSSSELAEYIQQLQGQISQLEKDIQQLKVKNVDADSLLAEAKEFETDGVKGRLVFADVPMDDRKVLSSLSDRLRDGVRQGVVVVIGQGTQSHPLIVSVSKELTSKLNAGKLLSEVARTLGGKGGGRPDFAQGAVPDRAQIPQARAKLQELLGITTK